MDVHLFLCSCWYLRFKEGHRKRKKITTYGDLARDSYKEAGVHLPFASTFHNLWEKKKILHELKYGTKEFKMRDHRRVEKILADPGMCSHAGAQLFTWALCNFLS